MTTLQQSSEKSTAPGNQIVRQALWVLAAMVAAVGVVLALLPATGHDQLWCLYVGGRMLDGVRLYGPQIFESNPPLIMGLSAVAAWVARGLGAESTAVFKAFGLLSIAATGLLSASALRRLFPDLRADVLRPALCGFAALAYLAVPARDFGQREHLLSILVLPYLLLAALDGERFPLRGVRAVAGVLAAVGLCLKPQQALLPVAVEGLLLLEYRSVRPLLRRPEPCLLAVLCPLYVGLIAWLTPAYFRETLPVLRQTYWAIGHLSFFELLMESIELQLLLLVAVALFVHRGFFRSVRVTRILLVAGIAADAAYMLQGTGWYYQQLPAIVFLLAAVLIQTGLMLGGWSPGRWLPRSLAAVGLLAVGLTLHFSGYPVTRARSFAFDSPDPALFEHLAAGTPVAILTTSVDEAMMPVARYRLQWAQRTNNLWWMPAILRSTEPGGGGDTGEYAGRIPPAQAAALIERQHRNMVEDLQRWRPVLVLVERCYDKAVECQVIEDRHDNLLEWFQRDPAFNAEWAHYAAGGADGRFDVYRRQ